MSARDLLRQVRADGMEIIISAAGRLRYAGPEDAVARWLPAIREHKDAILAAFSEAKDRIVAPAWLLHFTDADSLEVYFSPQATHTEALEADPDAVAAEPIKIVEPVSACRDCRHRKRPGLADPGYCAQRADTPHAYGEFHPLHLLPDDGGASCRAFEEWT